MHAAFAVIVTVLLFNAAVLFVAAVVAYRAAQAERKRPPAPTIHHDRREHRDRDRSNPDQ